MRARVAEVAASLAVACLLAAGFSCALLPPNAPRASVPIATELMCSSRAASEPAVEAPPPEERASCAAAIGPRLERLKDQLATGWLPPSFGPGEVAQVQLQFEFDEAGHPVQLCVLGGTGDAEARAALKALASVQPRKPLSRRERCVLGQPLVSTFSHELDPPAR